MGKTEEWAQARVKLKKIYEKKGITTCEVKFGGCTFDNFLSFAHRYKRQDPRCAHDFGGTILACVPCHQKFEYNKGLTEELFEKLR